MKEALEAYINFVNGKDSYGNSNLFLENISLLYKKRNSAKQHLVLLLAGRRLHPEIFSALCRDIESFLFVCLLVKEEIRTFEKIFSEWSLGLSRVKTMEDYKIFANDTFHVQKKKHASKFFVMFREIDNRSLPKYQIEYLLGKLTQFVDRNAYGGDIPLSMYCDSRDVHLEHILPRQPDSEVFKEFGVGADDPRLVWSVGNLALVEKSINMSLGNKPFSQKKFIYPKSRYLLTQIIFERPDIGNTVIDQAVSQMGTFDEWNKESIHQRARWLARLACIVWDVPVTEE